MQDRYVGDIGDFAKLILLRSLASECPSLSLGVVWCCVSGDNETNNDGKHRAYRQYVGKHSLKFCDEELFESFSRFDEVSERKIKNLEDFITATTFLDEAEKHPRIQWHEQALASVRTCDIVFFDPDNGIQFSEPSDKCSCKHIHISELESYWGKGQSLLIYHHLPRKKHKEEIENVYLKLKSFRGATVSCFHIRRGTARVFFLVKQPSHKHLLSFECKNLEALTYTKQEWASKQQEFCLR